MKQKPLVLLARFLMLAVGGFLSPMHAEVPAQAGVHLTFAVPNWESRISLGVFDVEGNLVRVLSQQRMESEFQIGLNGLIVTWDGKNTRGEGVPAGEYFVRGFATGLLEAEGVAYSGNDWLSELGETFPATRILDIASGPRGMLLVLGVDEGARSMLMGYDPLSSAPIWSREIELSGEKTVIHLAADSSQWLVLSRDKVLELLDPETGTLIAKGVLPQVPNALSLHGDELFVFHNGEITRLSLLGFTELPPVVFPGGTRDFLIFGDSDPATSRRLAVDAEGRLWTHGVTGWTILPIEGDPEFGDIALSGGDSFWALVRERGSRVYRVGQFDLEGNFLRQIEPRTFDGQPEKIVSWKDSPVFVMSRLDGRGSEVAGIRPPTPEGTGVWELFFQRRINPQSLPVPEGYRELPVRMKLEVAGVLQQGRESSLFRISVRHPDTIWLSTVEGLPVCELLHTGTIYSAAVNHEQASSDSLKFWVISDGRAEEFVVRGLSRMARIDLGKIQWPPE